HARDHRRVEAARYLHYESERRPETVQRQRRRGHPAHGVRGSLLELLRADRELPDLDHDAARLPQRSHHADASEPGQEAGGARAAARHPAGNAQLARAAADPNPELPDPDVLMPAPIALADIARDLARVSFALAEALEAGPFDPA